MVELLINILNESLIGVGGLILIAIVGAICLSKVRLYRSQCLLQLSNACYMWLTQSKDSIFKMNYMFH